MRTPTRMLKKSILYLWVIFGWIFFILGVIGAFLPLLPTTPFLLLSAFCFNRGSPHFHSWLITHKYFGPPIRDWQEHRAIKIKYKILSSTMMLISLYFMYENERIPKIGRICLVLFIFAVSLYIWTRKSKDKMS